MRNPDCNIQCGEHTGGAFDFFPHHSDPKVVTVQSAIKARDPFCTGTCTLENFQRFLYYTHGDLVWQVTFHSKGTKQFG
ncbi:hypothetical protein JVU11DRAFT_3058 [Chiua virens]|nr:hypothetical protein JVU11DRAFT_3058 [Chiua virens]